MNIKPLGTVVEVKGGFAFKSKNFVGEGIPIVRISNIVDGKVDLSIDPVYYPKESLVKYRDYQLKNGDVLIAMSGATTGKIGKVRKGNTTCLLNQRVGKFVRKNNSVLQNYLFWVVQSPYYQKALWNYAAGCAQPNVSPKQLESIKIPILPLPLQKKIASILEKCESAIQKRKEANRLTDEFLKSTFLEMFRRKNYKIVKLNEVCKKITDGTHKTPKYVPEGIPFLSVKNVKTGYINLIDIKYITEEEHLQIISRCKPEKGDILYTKVGTIGFASLVDIDIEFSIFVSVALLKPDITLINPVFLKWMLNCGFVKHQALRRVKGIGVPDLHLVEIKDFDIWLPPVSEQQKFANLVQRVEKLKQKQRESEKELDNLFNSLMQKAFRGEL